VVRVNTIWPELNAAFSPGRLTQEYGPAFGNIKVVYVAGFPPSDIPTELAYAARIMVAVMRRQAEFGGMLNNESITDYSYSLRAPGGGSGAPELASVRQILLNYREIAIGDTTASAPGGTGR